MARRSTRRRDELILANGDLVMAIVRRRYARAGIDFEDLLQIGMLGLIEAAESYRPSRGRFSIWASLHINAFILKELRKDRRRLEWRATDEGLETVADDSADHQSRADAATEVLEMVAQLPPGFRGIIVRAYGLGRYQKATIREIARSNHCSSATVCVRKEMALDELRAQLTA